MEEREQAPDPAEGAPNEGATGHVDPEEAAEEADTAAADNAAADSEPNQGATGDEADEQAGRDE